MVTASQQMAEQQSRHREVVWLDDPATHDAALVGEKAASLGRLQRAGFPVPCGFVVTATAYRRAAEESGLREARRALAAEPDPEDLAELAARAEDLASTVSRIDLPPDLVTAIVDAYQCLDPPGTAVAVRSSAAPEAAADISFAGVHATYTRVTGRTNLLDRVRYCWASLHGARAVAYRARQGLVEEPAIAVMVQRMVDADRAGVAFTADPATGDTDSIVVEGTFGLGEAVASGAVEPDTYVLDAQTYYVRSLRIGAKTFLSTRGDGGDVIRRSLPPERATSRALNDEQAVEVARLAGKVAELYGKPMDIEWAYSGDELWLLRTRPIPALSGAWLAARTSSPRSRTR
jgi:pyruvate,water dikinase